VSAKSILVDLDGVLLDFIGPLCRLLNRPDVMKGRWPGPFRDPEQFQAYALEETLSAHELRLVATWMEDGTLAEARSWYKNARALMAHITAKAPAVILTAGANPAWNQQTRELLASSSIRATVTFASPETKVLTEGLTLIEDRPDTATLWSEQHRRFSILLDRPWNRSATLGPKVLRARDFAHVRSLLEAILR